MKIAVVSNGEISDLALLSRKLSHFKLVLAVDNGLRHLMAIGRKPDVILGDFDSVSKESLALFPEVPRQSYPTDKDFSDTELAVDFAFLKGAETVTLFGATGGLLDHTLANLFLLAKYPGKLTIETESETLYAVHGFINQTSRPGQRLSLFSLGDQATGVTTRGLKWNLDGATVNSRFFSLSNVILDHEFEVSIQSGTLICVIQNG